MIVARDTDPRACVPIADRRRDRRRCSWCRVNRGTHYGKARVVYGGKYLPVVLVQGCEWCVRQWVRSPAGALRASRRLAR